jgi:transposase
VLAYFDRPGTSNGPTEAINGRLEHLRGSVKRPRFDAASF